MNRPLRIVLARSLLAGLGLAVSTIAQVKVPPDPYTGGDAAAMKKLGYESFGPFEFGASHTSTDVEALLGDEKLVWIETAHFRIGCALSELKLRGADTKWVAQVKKEAKQLRKLLPKVPKTPRKLDPWLRAHLVAQRLEACYAEICADLGVRDGQFPTEPQDPAGPAEAYFGEGRYLGMPQKFSVLITKRAASLARYTRKHTGGETTEPFRAHSASYGGLAFVIAEESSDGQMANDHALHTQLVYNVVINLINGYRSYGHDIPPWLVFGLAHWHSRKISPRYPAYERKLEGAGEAEDSPFWKWDERAVGLLKYEAFESIPELMARPHIGGFGMEEHIQCWFFVDYLMSAQKQPTMQLVHAMKAPFDKKWRLPTHDELQARQAANVKRLFGKEPSELEVDWRKYVRTNKRRK